MDRAEREHLKEVLPLVDRLAPLAQQLLEHRSFTAAAGEEARRQLAAGVIRLAIPGGPTWRLLTLGPQDQQRLGALAAAGALEPLRDTQHALLAELAQDAAVAAGRAQTLTGMRRFFTGPARRTVAEEDARQLMARAWDWEFEGIPELLGRFAERSREPVLPISLDQALDPRVGVASIVGGVPEHVRIVPLATTAPGLSAALGAADALSRVPEHADAARREAISAGEAVADLAATRLVEQMPLERLRDATAERLRVGALRDAGYTTVADVLAAGRGLAALPGIGEVTARRMAGAADTLKRLAREDAQVRLDPHDRSPEATRLVHALRVWEVWRGAERSADLIALAQVVRPLAERVNQGATHVAVLSGPDPADADAAAGLSGILELVLPLPDAAADLERALGQISQVDAWDDLLARPADYSALLAELGLVEETGTYGDLPIDVIEAVREFELDDSLLTVSLRGYQSFGARFALVQKKVLIGDEMGLGKTIEALAVLAHLAARGSRWFVVVCPAAVVSGWAREVESRTGLAAARIHGRDREAALMEWRSEGGVAVTTFETLGAVWSQLDGFEFDGLVVDEAHYVKNPSAARSQRVSALIARTEYVVLLTGTPLENRVGEFATLVGYLRPDLLAGADVSAAHIRTAVAPVYLRRNTEDVLTELPDLVEVEDWMEFSPGDEAAYREAVVEGNFMAMRRAAYVAPDSAKLERLVEIVEEAEDNGRRVLVFSFFRDVLERVAAALPGPVFGPLTGSVPAQERQVMVDEFSAAAGGAALVAQIQAGGVGLNVQAASVVVLCEPQVKPTTEWQAIARARRMGQLESVQVHRLLAEDSVDERILDIVTGKTRVFEDVARISETALAAPEAYDVSEVKLARQVVAAERARLLGEEADTGPDVQV